MTWKAYFKTKGVRPGRIVTHRHGELDFREDNIPLETIQDLFENDFPFLELTDMGRRNLYGSDDYTPTVKEVVQLIKSANTDQEAEEYAALKPESITVQNVLKKKKLLFK